MIKRKYFYSIKWIHADGNGSYSFQNGIATSYSIFSDPDQVYSKIKDEFSAEMEAILPSGQFRAEAFNRV